MSLQYKTGYCRSCDSHRKVERPGAHHILHFLMSVVTGGLWIPIWILSAIRIGGWRCSLCGSTKIQQVA